MNKMISCWFAEMMQCRLRNGWIHVWIESISIMIIVMSRHSILSRQTEQKHQHIICSVHFSSKAIKIWSTFPENSRISDAQNAKNTAQKHLCVILAWGLKRCKASLIHIFLENVEQILIAFDEKCTEHNMC